MARSLRRLFMVVFAFASLTAPVLAGYDAGQTLNDKLKRIVLPKLSFEDAAVKDVFSYIKEEAKRLDVEAEGVNFMFACKPESLNQQVTLDLDKIPLGEAIRYVCMGTGLGYHVETNAVVVGDGSDEKDHMQIQVYHIDAGVLDTKKTKGQQSFGDN